MALESHHVVLKCGINKLLGECFRGEREADIGSGSMFWVDVVLIKVTVINYFIEFLCFLLVVLLDGVKAALVDYPFTYFICHVAGKGRYGVVA